MTHSKELAVDRKTLWIALTSNTLEFYDLTIYAFFFHVFADQFMEPISPTYKELMSWLAFAAAFLARPLGSLFFGSIGDRYERRVALTCSIMGMSLATLGVGLLPDFSTIGIFAPLILFSLRFLQGFCLGGECNGLAIYLLEKFDQNNNQIKRFLSSMILASSMTGALLAIFVALVTGIIDQNGWYWRISFVIGSSVGFLGLYIRSRFIEAFLPAGRKTALGPLLETLQHYLLPFFTVMILSGLNGSLCYLLLGYLQQILLNDHHLDLTLAYLFTFTGILALLLTLAILGKRSHYLFSAQTMRQHMLKVCLSSIFLTVIAFILISIHNIFMILCGVVILGHTVALLGVDLHWFVVSLFPPSCRYTGASLAFSLGMAIFGGTTPALCTLLMNYFSSTRLLIIYPCTLAILSSILIVILNRKTATSSLHIVNNP